MKYLYGRAGVALGAIENSEAFDGYLLGLANTT